MLEKQVQDRYGGRETRQMSAGGFFFCMENSAKNSHTNMLVGKVKTGYSLKILICDAFFLNTGFLNCFHITLCSKSQQIN